MQRRVSFPSDREMCSSEAVGPVQGQVKSCVTHVGVRSDASCPAQMPLLGIAGVLLSGEVSRCACSIPCAALVPAASQAAFAEDPSSVPAVLQNTKPQAGPGSLCSSVFSVPASSGWWRQVGFPPLHKNWGLLLICCQRELGMEGLSALGLVLPGCLIYITPYTEIHTNGSPERWGSPRGAGRAG